MFFGTGVRPERRQRLGGLCVGDIALLPQPDDEHRGHGIGDCQAAEMPDQAGIVCGDGIEVAGPVEREDGVVTPVLRVAMGCHGQMACGMVGWVVVTLSP